MNGLRNFDLTCGYVAGSFASDVPPCDLPIAFQRILPDLLAMSKLICYNKAKVVIV